MTVTVATLAVFGVLLGIATLVAKTGHVRRVVELGLPNSYTTAAIVLGATSGFGFLGAGLVAHVRRPENRVGLLMVLVGVGFFAEDLQLARADAVHSIGLLFIHASDAFLVHLVLAFPRGRLALWRIRLLTAIAYAAVFGLPPVIALFRNSRHWRMDKRNLLLIVDDPSAVRVFERAFDTIAATVAVCVVAVLVLRWIRASTPQRRVIAPVYLAGVLGGAGTVVTGLGDAGGWINWLPRVAFCLLPFGFLVGVLRARLGGQAVGSLVARLGRPMSPAQLEAALARGLGDPSLRVGYWRPEAQTFVDGDGQPLELPATGDGVRLVAPDGRRVAVLRHDPALREQPHLLDAVAAAAELALENQRLTAEVRAQLAEVRDLAGRLVVAGDAERRRLHHDLHDGAQQRLVVAALSLRMAIRRIDGTADAESASLLRQSATNVDAVIGDLRELARGIRPAILTDAGLVAAVQALAERTPGPAIDVRATDVPRLAAAEEATGYFVTAEALTNALKHANADRITITVTHAKDVVRIDVSDDGVGGADLRAGSGLLGLRDRVTALGGTLSVHSGPAAGTVVSATIPVHPLPPPATAS